MKCGSGRKAKKMMKGGKVDHTTKYAGGGYVSPRKAMAGQKGVRRHSSSCNK